MTSQNNKASELITRTQGTGKDLVFLHGWGMNSGVFAEFVPLLTQTFRVTTIDLPGFGENHLHVPGAYTVATLAAKIEKVLPDNCVLVGWSLGGLVAQQLALIAPQKVQKLITVASTARFIAGPGWPGIAPALLKQFEHDLVTDYKKTLERFLAIQAMGSDTARQDIKLIKRSMATYPNPSQAALADALALLSTEDLRSDITQIKQPTLRIFGRLDSLVPVSAIDPICELHPGCDAIVLSKASHAPFISHPHKTADAIRQFLS